MTKHNPKLDRGRHVGQLGMLGGSNHFIEVCLEERRQGSHLRQQQSAQQRHAHSRYGGLDRRLVGFEGSGIIKQIV